MKKFFTKHKIHFKIFMAFAIMAVLMIALFYPLMPIILNYPADTYGNEFQWELEKANYTLQFVEITLAIFALYLILLFKRLSFLNNFDEALKDNDAEKLTKIRNNLFKAPNDICILQILLPCIGIPILYALSTKIIGITTIKVFIIYASFITLIATFSSIYIRKEFAKLLNKINLQLSSFDKKSSLSKRLSFQITPLLIVALLFTSLLGYCLLINEAAPITYEFYSNELKNVFNEKTFSSVDELYTELNNVDLLKDSDLPFIRYPDGTYYNKNRENINFSNFWIKYMNEFSMKDNSMVYDYYGVDVRGAITQLNINGENFVIGVQYDLTSASALIALGISALFLFLLNLLTLHISARSLAKEVQSVSDRLERIVNKVGSNESLPIVSNDELGTLSVSFNKIQDLTKSNIDEIQNNQNMLIEKERLASLGQMIGGIAHNMKTPIMSIAGASEGLTELIAEYVASIDNPSVNSDDHKEIAKDMLDWVTKIKTHTSYMSDIITAVKGQAAQLSASVDETFTIYDLSKRVDILIKHEIKKALVTLNTTIDCNPTISLRGDINNLIQVINNLITNSIQSYNGNPNEIINFNISADEQNVYFKVSDTGCGMSEETQRKLFKEMYTTKGKNGTGLGLYMSYSTIKGKFNGTITFESKEGKGTTFTVTIPLNN